MIYQSENLAVIDLGTNTFHLIIYSIIDGKIDQVLYQKSLPVKLKEGGWKEGMISEDAFLRAELAIQSHCNVLKDYEVSRFKAIGTEGLRIAKNSKEFLHLLAFKYDLEVEIISGQQEAKYIYYGVMKYHKINGNVLIMDIGGGSVEFIIADQQNIYWKKSIPIGASKLKNRFHVEDKISEDEQEDIKRYLKQKLTVVFEQSNKYAIDTLVGTSGSFETIYDVLNYKRGKQYDSLWNLYPICVNAYNQLHQKFVSSSFDERLAMDGMTQFRADMMVVSSILIQTIISKLKFNNILLARTAIKEGVAYELLNPSDISA